MNDLLRFKVRELKLMSGVSYKEVAEYMEMSIHSFYNWLNNQYNLSYEKQQELKLILEDLKGV